MFLTLMESDLMAASVELSEAGAVCRMVLRRELGPQSTEVWGEKPLPTGPREPGTILPGRQGEKDADRSHGSW